jgi:hypothetical protein
MEAQYDSVNRILSHLGRGGPGDQNSDSPGPVLGHHALIYEDVSGESSSRAQAMAALISFIVFVGR